MSTGAAGPEVADAVRSHRSWMTALAGLPGGAAWSDGGPESPCDWAFDGPYATAHCFFPDLPDLPGAGDPPRGRAAYDAVARGLARCRDLGAAHVAIWSATEPEDPQVPALMELGFEVGWQPCWMGASLTAEPRVAPPIPAVGITRRVVRTLTTRDAERAREPLLQRDDTWRMEARAETGRYAGRAWCHLDGGAESESGAGARAAGLYDMAVRPAWRRQGHGRELVLTLAAEAARRGADRITLNATPEGRLLYAACGLEVLGHGRTWWWHAA